MKYLPILLLSMPAMADSYHQFSFRYQDGEKLSDLDSSNLVGFGFKAKRQFGDVFYLASVHHQQGGDTDQLGFEAGLGYQFDRSSISYVYFGETLHEYWGDTENSKGAPVRAKDTDWRQLHRIVIDYNFDYVDLGYSFSYNDKHGHKYQHGLFIKAKYAVNENYSVFLKATHYPTYKFNNKWLEAPLFQLGFEYKL